MKNKIEPMKDKWRQVSQELGKYGVILRPGSCDTTVYFYASEEDLSWAMNNSWFDPREALPFKAMEKKLVVKEVTLK